MKTHIQIMILFLLICSVSCTYLNPIVFAEEPGDQNQNSFGDSSGNQQQGPANNTNKIDLGGNQTRGQNQSGSGEQGYGNENKTFGDQHRYRYQYRTMNIDGEGNYTRIRSHYRNNNTDVTFEIFFTIDKIPTLQLVYNPTLNASSAHHHFNLSIEQLIEYNDINENGKYDHNDIIRSTLLMSNITFTNITYTNSTSPEGNIITILETHTPDNLFSIIIYIASERASVFNNIITPEEIKIDFNIYNYPFVNHTSQLALITYVDTPFTVKAAQNTYDEQQGRATQESGLNISSVNYRGFFSWANTATIDNINRPINVTVISETEQTFTGTTQETYTHTQVIFSYPHGALINYDPKIGVIDILQDIIPSVLQFEYLSAIYLITCATSAIVFYGIIRYRKR